MARGDHVGEGREGFDMFLAAASHWGKYGQWEDLIGNLQACALPGSSLIFLHGGTVCFLEWDELTLVEL